MTVLHPAEDTRTNAAIAETSLTHSGNRHTTEDAPIAGQRKRSVVVMSEHTDDQDTTESNYPKTCQTGDCYRRAVYHVKAFNPENPSEPNERVLCQPCRNVYDWCASIPYSEVSVTQIRTQTSTDGGVDQPKRRNDQNSEKQEDLATLKKRGVINGAKIDCSLCQQETGDCRPTPITIMTWVPATCDECYRWLKDLNLFDEQRDKDLFYPDDELIADGGNPSKEVKDTEENAQEFVLTDANGHTIEGERYRDPDAAIDARVRLMETHPDGDKVTVEPWGEGFKSEVESQ